MYDAWPRLEQLGWIEEIADAAGPRRGRKPCRATSAGVRAREDWLFSRLPDDPVGARREFRFRIVSLLRSDEGVLPALLDLYEAAAVAMLRTPVEAGESLAADLLRDRRAAWSGAQIVWVSDLRDRLSKAGMLR